MSGIQKDPSPEAETKKRRACDECRTRKLACTKEADGCRRCKREGIPCVYSAQKPMGRPRKRPRTDEEEAQNNTAPTGNNAVTGGMPDGDVGLSILSEQVSSPGLTFFDFLGMGDNPLDPNLTQQQYQQPQQNQGMDQNDGLPAISSFTSAMATANIPGLTPPATTRQSPQASATHRYDNLFPRSLFGINFNDIDFNPGSADVMGNSVPTSSCQNNNTASPSGGSDVPSLTNGSQSTQGNSPTVQPTQPMVTTGLAPGMPDSSPHGWHPRQPPIGILPPSPKIMQQQMPAASQEAPIDTNQLPPFKPSPLPVAEGQPLLLGGIPTSTPVDAYSKASAAWLLTAPNRVCGCLARLYLALDSLQHLPTEVGPAMSVARNAAHTAHDTILCPSCSPPDVTDLHNRPPLQAFQNLMILGALLPSIAHTYRRIVTMVDEEAARASAAKKRLPLSLTEYGGVWGHMARWDNVCAQTSNMDNSIVEPPLWRLVVRAMLKMDVYGIHLDREDAEDDGMSSMAQAAMSATGATSTPASQTSQDSNTSARPEGKATGPPKPGFFMVPVHFGLKDIADMMEERAKMRHKYMDAAYDAGLIRTNEEGGDCGYRKLAPGEKHNCQKVIEMAKQEIDRLVIV
ncbi:hypothetical protein SEUCBS139899_003836 [Sporothrix eucalyptigena]|uniref:Zn(2)-C6 fungal-type domain-containing protein n=1 Tax=Sporothrix eucalyptigena TaxID=1812306 RepID=A0ABP0BE69_9PEZI